MSRHPKYDMHPDEFFRLVMVEYERQRSERRKTILIVVLSLVLTGVVAWMTKLHFV